jgi:hypothetical protein
MPIGHRLKQILLERRRHVRTALSPQSLPRAAPPEPQPERRRSRSHPSRRPTASARNAFIFMLLAPSKLSRGFRRASRPDIQ